MTERKTIVCLANSRKHHGRCIAGIEIVDLQPRGWVRPVSARPGAEVSEEERRFDDGTDPQVLDVISVPLLRSAPAEHQPENWTLDPRQYWTQVGRIGWDRLAWLAAAVPAPGALWPSQAPSTRRGLNDRVLAEQAAAFRHSICLIGVTDLRLQVFAPDASFNNLKRRVQAVFTYGDIPYRLWVTDPVIEREYLVKENGAYPLGESYLTVSLGEESTDEYCYKLIAAVLHPARVEKGG